MPREGAAQISPAALTPYRRTSWCSSSSLSGVRNPALRPEELPPTMFLSMSTTLWPVIRNSMAAETPANPAPTMTTSHLMSRVSGGQCRCSLTSSVVNHQF